MVEELLSRVPDGQPPEGGREQICAYFELLRVYKVVITIETEDGVEMEGTIQSLDGTKGRLVLHIPRATAAGMKADDEIDLLFTVAGNRWVGRGKIHYRSDLRDRYSVILPERLEPSDRRRELRAMLDPLENIRSEITIGDNPRLQIQGRLSNISEGGFRFSMETVLDLDAGEERDPEELDLDLTPGRALEHVQIAGLREEALVTQGRVMDLAPGPFGAILGVRFKALKPKDRMFLRDYVQHHAFTPPEVLPPLHHIPFAEEILQEINAAAEAAQELPSESVAPEPLMTPLAPTKKQASPLAEPRPVQAQAPRAGPAKPADGHPVPETIGHMRLKRFRSVALVMAPGEDRQGLLNFLSAQGFTRVLPAGTVGELTQAIKKGSVDLALVDWGDPGVTGLDIADFLLHYPFKNLPKVILACPHVTTTLANEAHSKGVMHLLVKPYVLDTAFVEMLLGLLGEE